MSEEMLREVKALVRRINRAGYDPNGVDSLLNEVCYLMGGYGIEAIRGGWVDGYYCDVVALYVNMGDTYITTVVFDTTERKARIMSWGDFVEHNERKYQIC